MKTIHILKLGILSLLLATLIACGGAAPDPKPDPTPPVSEAIEELVEAADAEGNLDIGITVTIINQLASQSLTTVASGTVRPTLLEVEAETPKGRKFKAVLVGSHENQLPVGSAVQMKLRGRKAEINNQPMIVGFAELDKSSPTLSQMDPSTPKFAGYSFLATAQNIELTGPEVGSIYNMDGNANFRGFCTEEHVVGAALFTNRFETVRVLNASLARLGEVNCPNGQQVSGEVEVNFESVVVDTHIGKVLKSYGAMQVIRGDNAFTLPLFTIGVAERLSDSIKQPEPSEAKPAENVRVLDPFAIAAIERVQGGMMFMRELPESLEGVQAGDILVARPYPRLPEGLLRKVTNVRSDDRGFVIATEIATLEDLFSEGGFSFERTISLEDLPEDVPEVEGVDFSAFNDPGYLHSLSAQGLTTQNLLPRVNINKQIVPGLNLVGHIDLNIRPVFSFACTPLCAQSEIIGKFVVTQQTKLGLEGNGNLSTSKTINLGPTIRLGTFVIPAGPIPITVTPKISFNATISADGRIELSTSATHDLELEVGIEKPFGEGFRGVNTLTRNLTFEEPNFNGNFKITARAAVKASITVIALSAFADLGPYVELDTQIPGNPTWKLDGGINSYAGLEYDIWLLSGGTRMQIFDRRWNIATSSNTPPTISNLAPTTPMEEPLVSLLPPMTPLNEVISFSANIGDFEDGSSCCSATWLLTRPTGTLVRQDTTGGSPSVSFTPDILGDYTLSVEARDSQGLRTTETFTFRATEPSDVLETFLAPTLEKTTAGDPRPNQDVSFRATTFKENDPLCCNVAWRVTKLGFPPPFGNGNEVIDTFSTTTSNNTHSHTRRFTETGSYKIEVTTCRGLICNNPPFSPLSTQSITVNVTRFAVNPPEITYFGIYQPVNTTPLTNQEITFAVNAQDDTTARPRIELLDNGVVFAESENTYLFGTRTYTTSGTKTITARVTDEDGNVTTGTLEFRVNLNQGGFITFR